MAVPEGILYLTEAEVQQTMTVGEAVELAERGITADAAGGVARPRGRRDRQLKPRTPFHQQPQGY